MQGGAELIPIHQIGPRGAVVCGVIRRRFICFYQSLNYRDELSNLLVHYFRSRFSYAAKMPLMMSMGSGGQPGICCPMFSSISFGRLTLQRKVEQTLENVCCAIAQETLSNVELCAVILIDPVDSSTGAASFPAREAPPARDCARAVSEGCWSRSA